jgi:hypothetical protein
MGHGVGQAKHGIGHRAGRISAMDAGSGGTVHEMARTRLKRIARAIYRCVRGHRGRVCKRCEREHLQATEASGFALLLQEGWNGCTRILEGREDSIAIFSFHAAEELQQPGAVGG